MLRIGAVSYLNTKPLIHGLRDRLAGLATLSLNLPSRLADDLAAGRLDVALIPSVEYFRGDNYEIVSDSAIACRGPVWSVRLLSRVPARQIKTLALDEGSRTSAAMVQVLLAEKFGLRPKLVPMPMEQTPETIQADAILLIGDRAMHPPRGVYREIWDLGDQWCRLTGKPFVFAPWVARRSPDGERCIGDEIIDALSASRDDGIADLQSIAAEHAAAHQLSTEDLYRYFSENLHFYLGEKERDGLDYYRQRAEHWGLIRTPMNQPATTEPATTAPSTTRPTTPIEIL